MHPWAWGVISSQTNKASTQVLQSLLHKQADRLRQMSNDLLKLPILTSFFFYEKEEHVVPLWVEVQCAHLTLFFSILTWVHFEL